MGTNTNEQDFKHKSRLVIIVHAVELFGHTNLSSDIKDIYLRLIFLIAVKMDLY